MSFDPADFLEQPLTRSSVDKLKRAEIELLVQHLELEDVIPVATLLKPALVEKVNELLYELNFFPAEKAEKEKEINELALEKEKREEEKEKREHEFRMRKLDLCIGSRPQRTDSDHFNITAHVKLVPDFTERDVDKYFLAFERAADNLKWPKEHWSTLLWSKLRGKALNTYAALSADQVQDYEVIKKEILKAYELVPEAYRLKFRRLQKSQNVTHVEFAREKSTLCDRWLMSLSVQGDYDKLRELLLLEDFKQMVAQDIRTYLEEHKYETLNEAAVAADEYFLTHKQYKTGSGQGVFRSSQGQGQGQDKHRNPSSGKEQNSKASGQEGSNRKAKCGHCKKSHATDKCWELYPELRPECTHCESRSHDTNTCFKLHPELRPKVAKKPVCLVQGSHIDVAPIAEIGHIEEPVKDSYVEFKSEGFVSKGEGQEKSPVIILRDTGCAQSLVVDNSRFQWGEPVAFINIQGVDCSEMLVPLYNVWLESEYTTGLVTVGMVPRLPMEGVDMILGNDIAGPKVKVTPRLRLQPVLDESTEKLQVEHPGIFPACVTTVSQKKQVEEILKLDSDYSLNDRTESIVVGPDSFPACVTTRSQKKQAEEILKLDSDCSLKDKAESNVVDTVLEDTFVAELFSNEESGGQSGTRLNRKDLVSNQRTDTTLEAAWNNVLSQEEAEKVPVCYYVNNEVLMRKWRNSVVPANETWNEVHQIVLPKAYRQEVMHLAHDLPVAGHLGVRKTLDRIYKHFFWPGIHSDVVHYCKTCHTCQMVGKPNQKVKVAPLVPIPTFGNPFDTIIIDCVGPLPKTKTGNNYLLTIMDTVTRYPEAIPLRKINTKSIVAALTQFFTRVGLPKVIRSDLGSNFTSGLFQDVLKELGIQHKTSSAYHPQTQGRLRGITRH